MIETYKILSGKYDLAAIPNLTTSTTLTTRSNDLRLQKTRTRYDLRKFIFTNKVVNLWNSLPALTWLCMQNLLIHLSQDWINSPWCNQEII